MKRMISRYVRAAGLKWLHHTGQFDITWRRLRQLKRLGFEVRFAVDGGAATGLWTEEFRRIFPHTNVLCVEPREDAQPALKALAARSEKICVAQTLLGDTEGTVEFHEQADQSSILPGVAGNPAGSVKYLPMATLDRLISNLKLPDPDLIKLDLQGAELVCLRGAGHCLREAQFIILEVSFIPLYKGAPLFTEIAVYMAENGFRLYDILSLWHRPLDGAAAFGDFMFIRNDHRLVSDPRWSVKGKWEPSLFR